MNLRSIVIRDVTHISSLICEDTKIYSSLSIHLDDYYVTALLERERESEREFFKRMSSEETGGRTMAIFGKSPKAPTLVSRRGKIGEVKKTLQI